ncbi:lytic transglycosylase domain-containing protein [Shimia abyssi]|uniref:Soluble lytic murein transglycosylase n=1 Tax=Shimia abyssi TaxID=1662395 RepID=A0A2P8F9B0_9RHOB|nr:lytic transglycosylase domain-containing protein [Shimia abyssi]PSL18309.1 soluble lytic murein transglycosylase [Shimia abyssi]
MLRLCLPLLLWVFSVGAIFAQGTADMKAAMASVWAKEWSGAVEAVAQSDAVARDMIEWHRLRAGEGTPQEVLAFLERRADWPGLAFLRKQAEEAFVDAPYEARLSFFLNESAQTAEGVLAHADVLQRIGEAGAAEAEIVLAWRTMGLNAPTQAVFLERHGDILKPHHIARLDAMLWKGWRDNSERMYDLVPDGWVKLAQARLGLREQVNGVDTLIAAVPAGMQSDPGLAHERFVWRHRKGRDDAAIELLLARSKAGSLGEAAEWAPRRRSLMRSQMRAGNYQLAYDIASSHGLAPDSGYSYSDCEWLSGYLALRFLGKPEQAAVHFVRFAQTVETPISLGRAGYWMGRAYEAMGDAETAQLAYAAGGAHQTSFYGLLAAEKAGVPWDESLRGDEVFADWRQTDWAHSSVHTAAVKFLEAGELTRAEQFWVHLSEGQDRAGLGQMGTMAQELGAPHIAVMLGKKIVRRGITLPGPYYALHPLKDQNLPVPAELSLAIARRESEFDPVVVSGAGARGLMQLMPGTARQVAAATGEIYSNAWLTSKPDYNARLGSAYLAGLGRQFDGNIIMISAGYNAGPGRPIRWMERNGDPRGGSVEDMVDWIEMIPFNETRNYVMRVSESLPVYRARLGKNPHPVSFGREIVGDTMLPVE